MLLFEYNLDSKFAILYYFNLLYSLANANRIRSSFRTV